MEFPARILNINSTSNGGQKATHFFKFSCHHGLIIGIRFDKTDILELKAFLGFRQLLFVAFVTHYLVFATFTRLRTIVK